MRRNHTLIIGGTRGIGRALVRTLAKENQLLSVVGQRQVPMAEQHLPNVRYYLVDLSDCNLLFLVLKKIILERGKINNLVFFQRYRGAGEAWAGEIQISLTVTKNIIERLVQEFDNTNDKSIVIVSSVAGNFIAGEQPLSYHVAKAGLNQMARYFAVNLGHKGIRVNCVSPATVLKDESKQFYLNNKKVYNLYKKITPLGRMGISDDVAQLIAFLCSPKASFITGQNIVIDGGISLQWHESLARRLTRMKHLKITRQTIGSSK